jgi:hypothetical protein
MHENYKDITSRIAESPKWYDQNGAPRYDDFTPFMCPNIYSDKVVLMRIKCQECDQEFLVEMHAGLWDDRSDKDPRKWHYGDPPAHCEGAGDSMNCIDLEVVECWGRGNPLREWKRVTRFEGLVNDTVF